ncbi:MAG: hypothetical protein KAY59_04860 [Acidobacteria bacterium]|nr:hypothetical protein [Acidobacteriota bacterium]
MRRLLCLLVCAAAVSVTPAAQSVARSSTAQSLAPAPTVAAHLALFDEVWTTINDSFYDPTFGGLDWPGVRAELRPKAAAAASMDDARAVVNDMLARLKRSHFALLSSGPGRQDDDMVLTGESAVDIDVRVLGADIVITKTRMPSTIGIKPGQRILSIDGKDMTPRSGEPALTSWRRVNAALHGWNGSLADVMLVGGTRIKAPRTLPGGQLVRFGNLPPTRVRVDQSLETTPAGRHAGVISFNIWMAQVDQPVASAVDAYRNADGLVFDLRGNPGGLAAMIGGVAGHILERADLLGTMRTRQIPQLKFAANPRTVTAAGRLVTPFRGPVAIIVDEMSASATECFAGGLQDLGRVRVFGRTSMGSALPASTRSLANGDVLEYVVGDFVTSKGRSLEGSGVVPDEIQPLSIASLMAGRDDALQAALAWIDKQVPGIR